LRITDFARRAEKVPRLASRLNFDSGMQCVLPITITKAKANKHNKNVDACQLRRLRGIRIVIPNTMVKRLRASIYREIALSSRPARRAAVRRGLA